jgi:hypothetical protein
MGDGGVRAEGEGGGRGTCYMLLCDIKSSTGDKAFLDLSEIRPSMTARYRVALCRPACSATRRNATLRAFPRPFAGS